MEGMSKKERLQLMARLALGKFEDSPFKKDIAVRRQRMDKVLDELGYDSARRESDRCTAINFRRVQACAKILGDEDSLFLDGLAATGVPLGVRGEIPWVPEVYDRKEKGEKEEMGPQWCAEVGEEPRSNYGSAIAHKAIAHKDSGRRGKKGLDQKGIAAEGAGSPWERRPGGVIGRCPQGSGLGGSQGGA